MQIRRELIIGTCVLILVLVIFLTSVSVLFVRTNCVYMQNMWKCCFQAIKKFSREEMCIIGAANNC